MTSSLRGVYAASLVMTPLFVGHQIVSIFPKMFPVSINTALILETHCLLRTAVRCTVHTVCVTEGFDVKVRLYQGSACFFAMVMDRMKMRSEMKLPGP